MKVEKRKALVHDALKNEDVEGLKKVSCPFYQEGNCAECIGCRQDEDTVYTCAEDYLKFIQDKPVELYYDGFLITTVKKRETKSKVEELVGIGLNCNSCYINDKCPVYQKNYECGIDWEATKLPATAKDRLEFLIKIQASRIERAKVFEETDGGVPDGNLSGEIDRMSALIEMKDSSHFQLTVRAETKGPEGGGILKQLLGGGMKSVDNNEQKAIEPTGETLDISPTIEDAEVEEIPAKKSRKKDV